ncbi:DUF7139 domain-containing protein [Halalkalicoccus salilacus]|uniref:DUF7139 domain-containing protein n=1 Tax=Halalkalicoccus sp. GCM10025704 TaxID=3252662 RepID=UPI003621A9C8
MAGLTEVYTGAGADASTRRLALGGGLFAVGVALAALGALFGTTELLSGFGYGIYESRRIAGVLAGFGVPAVFSGIVTVLPATRRVRVAAAGGATLAACGVLWFWMAYPADWAGYGRNLTLPVTALYLLGTTVTFACLFVGVARFKTRNAPGGTVSLDVVRKGETRFVEVERPAGVGSVGLIGTPSDTSETPTAPPKRRSNPAATAERRKPRRSTATAATASTSTTGPTRGSVPTVADTNGYSSRWTPARSGRATRRSVRANLPRPNRADRTTEPVDRSRHFSTNARTSAAEPALSTSPASAHPRRAVWTP